MKKIFLFILTLLVFIVPSLILADDNTTIDYLKSKDQNAWISQSLVSAGVSNVDISYIDYQSNNLMTAAKNILVLAANNSVDYDNIDKLVTVLEDSKNGGQFGSSDLVNDDFWSVMALASVSKLENMDSVKSFLINHQNEDGGWSWSTSGVSDSNDTAAAIMALLDLGYTSSSSEIIKALNYLKSVQNEDGGFGYDVDSLSDGASTAWIIAALNKLDIDASSWQKSSNNPTSFLESLRQEDGSFLWLASDEEGSVIVTAYALLALTGGTYPVDYIELEEPVYGNTLRIEGPDSTVCLANNLSATNVLNILELGSQVCDFDYTVTDSSYGSYVSAIDGIGAAGLEGWQYFVDYQGGLVAASDYSLTAGQEVLWAYGGFPFYAVRLEVNDTHFDLGDNLIANFNYYDGNNWLPLTNHNILFGETSYQTNQSGQLSLTLNEEGVFTLFSKQDGQYVRSNKEYIIVGDGVSQTVDLLVNIGQGNGGPGGGDTIAFSVDQSSINFGDLQPGQSKDTLISLTNIGTANIYIEASVLGDKAFEDFTNLDNDDWQNYSLNLNSSDFQAVNVALSIPSDFNSSGQKEGQLIFWAINQ